MDSLHLYTCSNSICINQFPRSVCGNVHTVGTSTFEKKWQIKDQRAEPDPREESHDPRSKGWLITSEIQ